MTMENDRTHISERAPKDPRSLFVTRVKQLLDASAVGDLFLRSLGEEIHLFGTFRTMNPNVARGNVHFILQHPMLDFNLSVYARVARSIAIGSVAECGRNEYVMDVEFVVVRGPERGMQEPDSTFIRNLEIVCRNCGNVFVPDQYAQVGDGYRIYCPHCEAIFDVLLAVKPLQSSMDFNLRDFIKDKSSVVRFIGERYDEILTNSKKGQSFAGLPFQFFFEKTQNQQGDFWVIESPLVDDKPADDELLKGMLSNFLNLALIGVFRKDGIGILDRNFPQLLNGAGAENVDGASWVEKTTPDAKGRETQPTAKGEPLAEERAPTPAPVFAVKNNEREFSAPSPVRVGAFPTSSRDYDMTEEDDESWLAGLSLKGLPSLITIVAGAAAVVVAFMFFKGWFVTPSAISKPELKPLVSQETVAMARSRMQAEDLKGRTSPTGANGPAEHVQEAASLTRDMANVPAEKSVSSGAAPEAATNTSAPSTTSQEQTIGNHVANRSRVEGRNDASATEKGGVGAVVTLPNPEAESPSEAKPSDGTAVADEVPAGGEAQIRGAQVAKNVHASTPERRGKEGAEAVVPPAVKERKEGLRLEDKYQSAMDDFKEGNVDSAIRKLGEIVKAKPDFSKAHKALGQAYPAKGYYQLAVNSLTTYLHLEPNARDRKDMEAIIEFYKSQRSE